MSRVGFERCKDCGRLNIHGARCVCAPPEPVERDAALAEHEACNRCGGENVSWATPSPLWNLVMRGGSIVGEPLFRDLVCIRCFLDLARQVGVAGHWRLSVTPEPPAETTTPSGRVWNPKTWLWDDAVSPDAPEVSRPVPR